MKTNKYFGLILLFIITHFATLGAPKFDEGKTIFTARCAACHNVNKQFTGPALAGVGERRSIDWIVNFVHSPQTMIGKADTTAVALFNKFKITMPDHKDLSEANIKSILAYINSETKPAETAPFAKPNTISPAYLPITLQENGEFIYCYLGSVVILIGVLYFAVIVSAYGRKVKEA